jgi:ABC-type phosphate/phosphonate transport system permease subunit
MQDYSPRTHWSLDLTHFLTAVGGLATILVTAIAGLAATGVTALLAAILASRCIALTSRTGTFVLLFRLFHVITFPRLECERSVVCLAYLIKR